MTNPTIEGLRLIERVDWIDVEIDGEHDFTFHRDDKPALLAALLEGAGAVKVEVFDEVHDAVMKKVYATIETGSVMDSRETLATKCLFPVNAYLLPIPEDTP